MADARSDRYRDGRSADTAMAVIDVEEEYDVLAVLGLRRVMQALSTTGGTPMDVHTVETRDGRRFSMYFDVSLPWSRAPFRRPSP